METVTDFIFLRSQIIADGDCNREIKRRLLFARKAMTNLESILKSRDIALLTKVHTVKATIFPVVMYWCKSWSMKKAECWRIDVFDLWCWRRFLRVPLTARRLNQSILKGINPKYSLEGLMLESEAVIFWPLDAKIWFIKEDPDAGKDWRQERKGATEGKMVQMASPTWWTWVWASSRMVKHREACCAEFHRIMKSWTWLCKWTTTLMENTEITVDDCVAKDNTTSK